LEDRQPVGLWNPDLEAHLLADHGEKGLDSRRLSNGLRLVLCLVGFLPLVVRRYGNWDYLVGSAHLLGQPPAVFVLIDRVVLSRGLLDEKLVLKELTILIGKLVQTDADLSRPDRRILGDTLGER
jgi:hypothetical protein